MAHWSPGKPNRHFMRSTVMNPENTPNQLPRSLAAARDQYRSLRYTGPDPTFELRRSGRATWWPKAAVAMIFLLGLSWSLHRSPAVIWEAEPSIARQMADTTKAERPRLPNRPQMPVRPSRASGFAAQDT